MLKLPRRQFLHLAAGAAALPVLPRAAFAADDPAQPVHIVAPRHGGSRYDIIPRQIAQALSDRLGRQCIVDGAGWSEGKKTVARAAPDGSTLLLAGSACVFHAAVWDHVKFEFERDLVPVAGIARAPFVANALASFPPKSVCQMIEYDKTYPGVFKLADADIPYKHWYGICAAKGTPAGIVDKLAAAIVACSADAALTSRLAELGFEPAPMSSAAFGKFIDDEIVRWGKMIWSGKA
jgi:tripartite-type tricarboxylate transporter receptor subunit TctC